MSDAKIALEVLSDELLKFVEKETGYTKEDIAKMSDDEFSDLYDAMADIEIDGVLFELDENFDINSDKAQKGIYAADFVTIVGNAIYRPMVRVGESYVCPVCGKYTFERAGEFDICEVCGWEDDLVQLDDPDEENCANSMSLNQAKEAWRNGQRVE